MDNLGWIKIHRKIQEWGWAKDPKTGWLFIHLLIGCSHKDCVYQGIPLKRGQWVVSYKTLHGISGVSPRSIRTSLNKLKSTGELTHEIVRINSSNCSLITIINWDRYQLKTTSETTSERHVNDTSATLFKNVIMQEGKKNTICPSDDSVGQAIDYLNQVTGHGYKSGAKSNRKHVLARIADGHTIEEIKLVVDHKFMEWRNSADMFKYLRPETLFGSKFDGYLQTARAYQKEQKECLDIVGDLGGEQ